MLISDREYREMRSLFAPVTENTKRLDSNYYVEGYATTFTRYLLWEFEGVKYYEEIAPNALDGADLSDVIMQYDHQGRVLARNRNGTLGVEADEKGIFMFADLSKSDAAKEIYNDISEKLIDRMSWAFTISRQKFERLDETTYLRRIEQIKKMYDVSAVSTPANDATEISARSFAERSFLAEQQERLGLQARKLQLKIKMEV
jgi:hypothetical protein